MNDKNTDAEKAKRKNVIKIYKRGKLKGNTK
jgi:hypothetical protein